MFALLSLDGAQVRTGHNPSGHWVSALDITTSTTSR